MDENLLLSAKQCAQELIKYLDEQWLKLKLHNEATMTWAAFVEKLQHICWVPVAPELAHPALAHSHVYVNINQDMSFLFDSVTA